MSGIAKPLVKFSTSLNVTEVVCADYIVDISKLNVGVLPNQPANTAKWLIVISYIFPNSQTKTAEIEFASQAARDTAFGTFETLVCATI